MSYLPRRRRTAGAVGLVVASALGAGVLAGAGPATSAPVVVPPAADCARPFPIADLVPGDDVRGLTVTRGTTPQEFTADVLGTLDDGIAPGVDMVMVKVDPAGLDIDPAEVKGIWQGMSGSPVYASDGRLIGAIAYGLSSQQSWVAGVTPFENMDDYLTAPTAPVRLSSARAARVARVAGVTAAQATRGFTALPVPLGVAGGVPNRFLHPSAAKAAKHRWLRTDTYAVGRAGVASGADSASMVAGGNLAASMSSGDVLLAGVGTVTSVCGDEVVGFGHPMNFAGTTTMTLHPAEALYVQGDAPSFKLANIGAPVGTVFGDHLAGITGRFGAAPATTSVTSTVTAGSRTRTGRTNVSTRTPDTLAMTTYYQGGVNHSLVMDGAHPGSEVLTWKVTGKDAGRRPFSLAWTDRIRAGYDVADEASMYAASYAEAIASMPDVTVDSIATSGTVGTLGRSYQLVRVDQRRAGAWVKVTEARPAVVKAGRTLKVRAVMRDGSKRVIVPFSFAVPARAAGRMALLSVVGGASTSSELGDTVATARKALSNAVRNDTVRAQLGRVTDLGFGYDEEDGDFRVGARARRPGPALVSFLATKKSAPAAATMSGSQLAMVVIR